MAHAVDARAVPRHSRSRYGTGVYREILEDEGARNVSLRWLRNAVIHVRNQIRFWLGLAQFLGADRSGKRRRARGRKLRNEARGGSLRPLRGSPGACI